MRSVARNRERARQLLAALAVVSAFALSAGCGHSSSRSGGAGTAGAAARLAKAATTVHNAGLTVTLAVTPTHTKVGAPVAVTLSAYSPHAPSQLGYSVKYGDGSHAAYTPVTLVCLAGRGAGARQAAQLTHSYRAPGRYRVSVSVRANCTDSSATAALTVIIA